MAKGNQAIRNQTETAQPIEPQKPEMEKVEIQTQITIRILGKPHPGVITVDIRGNAPTNQFEFDFFADELCLAMKRQRRQDVAAAVARKQEMDKMLQGKTPEDIKKIIDGTEKPPMPNISAEKADNSPSPSANPADKKDSTNSPEATK